MLSRLCLSPSTNHTLLIEIEELPIVPVPMILPVWFPPNPTVPPSFMVRVRNIDLSPVMCREQPLSRYQDFCFSLPFRHTCNINNVWLRYPYFCGSSWVSPRSLEFSLCSLSEIILLCLLPDFRWSSFWWSCFWWPCFWWPCFWWRVFRSAFIQEYILQTHFLQML